MAERWDERDRNWRDERGSRGPEQHRGMINRGADEVRSWFGDDEAARRRRMDASRDSRDERDWGNRASNTAERAWDRTQETMRHVTDRDRDGRRGFAEWNDDDRPSDRSRSSAIRAATARRDEYWTGDRPYGDRGSYGGTDPYAPYIGSPWNTPTAATGQYAGRGPRGYTRGDERIREDVCDRLTDDPRVEEGGPQI